MHGRAQLSALRYGSQVALQRETTGKHAAGLLATQESLAAATVLHLASLYNTKNSRPVITTTMDALSVCKETEGRSPLDTQTSFSLCWPTCSNLLSNSTIQKLKEYQN